jgi:1,4-dihydroxy-2-naphthoate polyprenyltransferase
MNKNTLLLLRFPFSILLLPVYLWALCHVPDKNIANCIQVFIILHLLVYPASNGYNSYMDKDTGPIGGLENPPPPERSLFYATILLDVIAIIWSLFINPFFTLGIVIYILMSRLYSYRAIRLKQYPIIGFLTVFIFQGAWIFFTVISGTIAHFNFDVLNATYLINAFIASCFIGAIYPLTQIYQHQSDLDDGVTTLSFKLGYVGTFLFAGICFAIGVILLFTRLNLNQFILFNVFTLPTILFFGWWFLKVYQNKSAANFKNTMWMNVISCVCMNAFYIFLLIQ